jgi:ATP-dependent phosphoenolpyruvate carboxykinase
MPAPPDVSDPAIVKVFFNVIAKTPFDSLYASLYFNKNRNIYNESNFCGNNSTTAISVLIKKKIERKEAMTQLLFRKRPTARKNVNMETANTPINKHPMPRRLAFSEALEPLVEAMVFIFSRKSAIRIAPSFHPIMGAW